MLDLDRFKQINDRYGHEIGDETLRKFAAVIRAHEAGGLIAGRLGGEEFAIAASGSGEALRIAVEAMRAKFETAGKIIGGRPVGATFSAGVAGDCGSLVEALLRRADTALYLAKAAGRNRVMMNDPSMPDAGLNMAAERRHSRRVA